MRPFPEFVPGADGYEVLPRGRYRCSVNDLRNHFALGLPDEAIRLSHIADLIDYLGALASIGLALDSVWVDGSFVSRKINPGDIDCSPVVVGADSSPIPEEIPDLESKWIVPKDRWKYAEVPGIGRTVRLDVYGFVMLPDGHPAAMTGKAMRGHYDEFWQRSRGTGDTTAKGYLEVVLDGAV
jgi:hypothetical protein